MNVGRNGEKRQRILDAAVDLFRSAPQVRKVSIEDIAARAHVSPTTIYHYFGMRDALVADVAKRLILAITEQARHFLRSALPFPEKLQAVISGKIALASAMSDEVVLKMIDQDPAMGRFVENTYRTEIAPLWHEFLEAGKAEGYIAPDLDEEVFLSYLDILLVGFRARADLFKDWRQSQNLAALEKMTRLVFYGFLRKEIDLFPKEAQ